jgi:hypothetical protein
LIIIAIAALVLGVIYAWNHFKWFHDALVRIWDGIKSQTSTAVNAILTAIGWLSKIPGAVGRWFMDMYHGVVNGVSAAWKYISGIPGAIIRAFSGAGSWLYNVGKNIIIGLWNGLVSISGWLYNKIVSLAKAIIPAPIRWALGMKSPSKVMAEIGKFAGMGLAIGLDASSAGVSAAATRLAGSAVPAMSAFAAPAGVTAMAGAGAVGGSGGTPDVGTLAAAIKQALHGTSVQMDSKPVGQIVSQTLGRSTDQRRRTG